MTQTLEPTAGKKIFFLLSGVIVSVPVTLFVSRVLDTFCLLLPSFLASVCAASVIAPFVEEFAKAYPFFYRYEVPSKSLMTLGFMSGLGFGLSEFLIYVFIYQVPFFLRIHPILFHAASTSITAYGVSQRSVLRFYSLAVALHLLNNLFATIGGLWFIGAIAAALAAYYLSYMLFRKPRSTATPMTDQNRNKA